jgi:predicted kinase
MTARRARAAPPTLVVLAGLPGAGKSTIARALVERRPMVWLRVDVVEAALLASGFARSFETGLAAYVVARDVARDHLRIGQDVVIDAVNGVEEARAMWRELAAETGARRRVIEIVCSDRGEHQRRIRDRGSPTPPLPAVRWEEVGRREYLPWSEPLLRLDGSRPVGVNVSAIVADLDRVGGRAPSPRLRQGRPRRSSRRRSAGSGRRA